MKSIVIVGQGPNEASWRAGFAAAAKFMAADPQALVKYHSAAVRLEAGNRFASNYCARLAITGAVGRRLAHLAGYSLAERGELRFYAEHARRNLNACWNGKQGKGDKFDRKEAALTAEKILAEGFERHVLLGAEVAKAFGCREDFLSERGEYFTPANGTGDRHRRFLVFPHPSGLSRWWNVPGNKQLAADALFNFLRK